MLLSEAQVSDSVLGARVSKLNKAGRGFQDLTIQCQPGRKELGVLWSLPLLCLLSFSQKKKKELTTHIQNSTPNL